MTREEFEKWIKDNNFKTIYSLDEKYIYDNSKRFNFSTVCIQGSDGMFGCFYEDSIWQLISYRPDTGDIPQIYYALSSNEKFNTEEEALETLKNKLITRFAGYSQCFICNSRFVADFSNIPSNQKTFYYKCPNCNAELKIGNPNYTENLDKESQEKLTDRDKLIKAMELPNDIRKKSEQEKYNILSDTIIKISRLLKEIKCDSAEYELSQRQQITKGNAINNIMAKDYLDAYYEIADFIDDYGDRHNGKIFEKEKQEINNLLAIIFNDIQQ